MTSQDQESLLSLRNWYRDGLLKDVIPFWLRHGVDEQYGGFITSLDRDGKVLDTDKGIWQQARAAWMLGTLYRTVEKNQDWLRMAKSAVLFLDRHGRDRDGRMFFQVTREGMPLRKRRYLYSECFTVQAKCSLASALGDETLAKEARELFRFILKHAAGPSEFPSKVNSQTRPMKGIGLPMILLNTAQNLRDTVGDDLAAEWVQRCIREIQTFFVREDRKVVLETVGLKGEILDHFDGRTLNPGHALEAAWFILHESLHRGGDRQLTELGVNMLEWMWRRGWDAEFGGLLYFVDLNGGPVQEYWHDMKFWWPQNEALIATLLAYRLTGARRFLEWHLTLQKYVSERFPDPEYGEWFGYFHRDGRLSVSVKGNLWKGMFHIPRMQWYCWKCLDDLLLHETRETPPAGKSTSASESGN